ncbi:hypothetical protein [Alkalispirochaeta alkalica]|uniref:hypothetical protein n=1 Tax=Alkalispirochaeta alkalica TaxID=46356 RepID=UPI0003617D8F|nr:hypothetical protein [Alkalispirochaeta alkalica]
MGIVKKICKEKNSAGIDLSEAYLKVEHVEYDINKDIVRIIVNVFAEHSASEYAKEVHARIDKLVEKRSSENELEKYQERGFESKRAYEAYLEDKLENINHVSALASLPINVPLSVVPTKGTRAEILKNIYEYLHTLPEFAGGKKY